MALCSDAHRTGSSNSPSHPSVTWWFLSSSLLETNLTWSEIISIYEVIMFSKRRSSLVHSNLTSKTLRNTQTEVRGGSTFLQFTRIRHYFVSYAAHIVKQCSESFRQGGSKTADASRVTSSSSLSTSSSTTTTTSRTSSRCSS